MSSKFKMPEIDKKIEAELQKKFKAKEITISQYLAGINLAYKY